MLKFYNRIKIMSSHGSQEAKAFTRLRLTLNHVNAVRPLAFASIDQGSKFSQDYKKYLVDGSGKIRSFMHDVPIQLNKEDKTVNMIVEIPRWSYAKFEINTKQEGNPIVQDVKKGKVRFIKNLFPHHGYIHNYGAIPQTWEDNTNSNGSLNLYGDNDPLDIVDIGSKVHDTGSITKVKVLGSLALVDDGELDWKVIAINVNDKLASKLNDIDDIAIHCPNLLEATREWFRNYKLPDGKPENKFAFDAKYLNQQETIKLIEENHQAWENLIQGNIKGENVPTIKNSTVNSSPGFVESFESSELLTNTSRPDTALPDDVFELYYHNK